MGLYFFKKTSKDDEFSLRGKNLPNYDEDSEG
jgi:hypothetical protein